MLTYYYVQIPTRLLYRSAVASHNNKSHCFSLKKAHLGAFFGGSGTFAFISYYMTHSPSCSKARIMVIATFISYYMTRSPSFFQSSYRGEKYHSPRLFKNLELLVSLNSLMADYMILRFRSLGRNDLTLVFNNLRGIYNAKRYG